MHTCTCISIRTGIIGIFKDDLNTIFLDDLNTFNVLWYYIIFSIIENIQV